MKDKTLFESKVAPAAPKPVKNKSGQRKTRSDKKKDIKPMIAPEDKKKLQLRAIDSGLSLTEFCSNVVKDYLNKGIEFNDYDYPFEGKPIHVLLEEEYFKLVELLHVEWDLPRRQVVHRIIKEFLTREFGGFEIISYEE